MKRQNLGLSLASCLAMVVLCAAEVFGQTYTFTGASDANFFNILNWDDGIGGMPASIVDGGTGLIELDLVIDGDTVFAGSAISYGAGSLSLLSGSQLNVTSGEVLFETGMLSLTEAELNILNDSSSQLDMNNGSTLSVLDSSIVATDDILMAGAVSISGSSIVSVADDIEFQTGSVISQIHDSALTTVDIVQIISFQSSALITDSTFSTGRLSIRTGTDLVAVDSVLNMNGDIDDAFNSFSNGTLTLQGDSVLRADQLDEGISLYLEDQSQASFIDDNAEGEWITDPGVAGFETKVVLRSVDASLSFVGPQGLSDDATQVFNGTTATEYSYAAYPQFFVPETWNQQDTVTIRAKLVPEPGSLVLGTFALLGCVLNSRRR